MATALITGASSGMGQATALTLAPSYDLVLCGRNVERLEQTKAQCLEQRPDCTVTLWPYDLAQTSNLEQDFKAFLSSWRAEHNDAGITKFAHCAGSIKFAHCACSGKMKHLHLVAEADFLSCYQLHCVSAGLIIKTLCSRYNQRALDAAVLLTSHNSMRAVQGYSFYQASKAAAETMARCLAIELAPKVRVNVVKPGLVQTPMAQEIFDTPEILAAYQARCPSGITQPQDVAQVVAFLLSDQARMITGEAIIVDGGSSIDGSIRMSLGK